MSIGLEGLKRQEEESYEWDSNKIKKTIQKLFKGPLNNSVYRQTTPAQAFATSKAFFEAEGVLKDAAYLAAAGRLLRKLEKAQTIDESVLVLGDYLLK